MIEQLATRAAQAIHGIDPQRTASVAVLRYGFIVFFEGALIAMLTAAIGWATGKPGETLLTLVLFVAIRQMSGGFHFRSSMLCIVFSTALLSLLPHIPLPERAPLYMTLCGIVCFAAFAPSGIKGRTRIAENNYKWLKIISIIFISINLLMQSEMFAKVIITQALLIVKYRR